MERLLLAPLARFAVAAAGLAIGALRLVLFPRRRPRVAEHVLVHRVGRVGDGACALPALAALRAAYPAARITLLTSSGHPPGPGLAELVAGSGVVDRVVAYSREDVRPARRALELLRELRAARPDAWIALPQHLTTPWTELRNVLFARLTGARWAGGFGISGARFLGRVVARAAAREGAPAEDEVASLEARLSRLGIAPAPAPFPLAVPPPERVRGLLPEEGGPLLALAPFASRPAGRWAPERFEALLDRWLAAGGRAVVLGAAGDRRAAERLVAGRPRTRSLAGATSLLEACGVLRAAAALAAADTGLVHLAAAAGTACVVVTAARDVPGRWAPHGPGHVVLRRDLACSPCWRDACPVGGRCLAAIEVEDAWKALAPHLAPPLAPHGPALPPPEAAAPGTLETPAAALPRADGTAHPRLSGAVQASRRSGR